MAIRPDYSVGTISLVASSANFTTTGASLQTAAVQAGDAIITPSGHVLIIASITGQNSGTLFLPCPAGAAGTNLPLRVRFQPDGSRYQGAVRNLVDLLSSGNVEAFAALVGENGLVPIFTGAGTMDLADPATFGIKDPNGSLAKLAALTLAARQVLQTDETGALKTLALAANKFLRTDANGDLALSDLGTAAIALLNLSGTAAANKLPYLSSATGASLADFTAAARALLNLAGTASADQLPYLTGASAAGLTPLTAFARSILDDANAASMWSTLGGAGFVVATNSATQTGAVGSYAMARTTSSTNVNPANNASGSDLYYANGNGAGALGVGSGSWKCMGHASGGGAAQNSTLWLRYA
ncbi:hypothetical protein IPU75_12235 [Ochrobactrum sp. SD129]|nr:hypothetical protein [Ochrobactrum sp. SD129]